MKSNNPLKEYFLRLLQQSWILVTGSVGFLITFLVGIFVPELNIRIVYIIIFSVALIIGGYSAFAGLLKEYGELDQKFHELEEKKPNIVVGFRENSNLLNRSVELNITTLSAKPDFDKWVKEKYEKLTRYESIDSSLIGLTRAIAGLANSEPNPNYKHELENYLREYREYLVDIYECGIDRAFEVNIAVENKGSYPANNVSVELTMPREYKPSKKHQEFDRKTTLRRQIESHLHEPIEPESHINRLNSLASFGVYLPGFDSITPVNSNDNSNTNGPYIEEREGSYVITYTIDKLIQHRPEKEFDPFWVWLGEIEESDIWEIPVRITSAELREPLLDTIFLKINISKLLESSAN
ncbi:MAG: hypothetical protein FJZ86_10715 [Chloroflexi bacterium]|nr:hypothetical protein [Chloroflexota bacterium]